MAFKFGKRSEQNLVGVHPDLVKVARRALEISKIDFCVIEGKRTVKRQRELVEAGASWTMDSRHIPMPPDNLAKAIDVAAWVGEIRWDWPLYDKIAAAMFQAALELKVFIIWGGNWQVRDGPHFELDRRKYP